MALLTDVKSCFVAVLKMPLVSPSLLIAMSFLASEILIL